MSNKFRLILSRLSGFKRYQRLDSKEDAIIQINEVTYSPKIFTCNFQQQAILERRDSVSIIANQSIFDLILNIYPEFNIFLSQFDSISMASDVLHSKVVQVLNEFVVFFRKLSRSDILSKVIELLECYQINPFWTVAHFAAYFNHTDYFLNVSVRELEDQNNPDRWSPLHIAVSMSNMYIIGLMLKSGMDVFLVDSRQWTVMHYAMLTSPRVISTLVEIPAFYQQLRHLDHKGMTPLHVACLAKNAVHLQRVMLQGVTARQLTISAPKPLSSQLNLIDIYQDYSPYVQFSSREIDKDFDWQMIVHCGNPLHWCQTWSMLNRLLEMKLFRLNQQNSLGDTPLITFTRTPPATASSDNFDHLELMINSRLTWMLRLITAGAHVNSKNIQGNTALHYAALNGFVITVQLLIIFGSRINARNNDNHSALHLISARLNHFQQNSHFERTTTATKQNQKKRSFHFRQNRFFEKQLRIYKKIVSLLQSIGARKCPKNLSGCTTYCSFTTIIKHESNTSDLNNLFYLDLNEQNCRLPSSNILVLDGGLNDSFINPLIQVILLKELEHYLKYPLLNYFDIISGTSFGFITGCSLAYKQKIFEIFNFFLKLKSNFKKPLIRMQDRNTEQLEQELKAIFGDSKTLTDMKFQNKKHLILTTTLVDSKPSKLKIIDDSIEDLPLWKACQLAGAGPGFYKTIEHQGVPHFDGSLVSPNPTIDVLCFYHNLMFKNKEKTFPISFVLSIGSGKAVYQNNIVPFNSRTFNLYPASIRDNFNYFRQLRNWFLNILMETDDFVVERSKYFVSSQNVNYARINIFYDKEEAKMNLMELSKLVEYSGNYHNPSHQESFEQMQADYLLLQILWNTKIQLYENRNHLRKLAKFLEKKFDSLNIEKNTMESDQSKNQWQYNSISSKEMN